MSLKLDLLFVVAGNLNQSVFFLPVLVKLCNGCNLTSSDPECLLVGNYTEPPQSISTTNTSLTLSLLPWQYDTSCSNISLPPVKYTLLYRVMKRENDIHDCRVPGICAKKVRLHMILLCLIKVKGICFEVFLLEIVQWLECLIFIFSCILWTYLYFP